MENTLLIGDFLLVDKLHFAGKPAHRICCLMEPSNEGDIVVFYFPVDASTNFLVKRVMECRGNHVRLRDKIVYVNGQPLPGKVTRCTSNGCQTDIATTFPISAANSRTLTGTGDMNCQLRERRRSW